MQFGLTRRGFLIATASAASLLSLRHLREAAAASAAASRVAPPVSYGDWEDLYRKRWVWDRRVRCTHLVNCWYQRNCAWDVFVKDGVVLREEQVEHARVDGAILEHIKFCDLHGTDNALLKIDLERAGIPVLQLERQYGPLGDAGRIRTRVQAFLERIRR
jgi:hypothetical protein